MDKKFLFIIGGGVGLLILIVLVVALVSGGNKPKAVQTGPVTLTFWKPFEDSENIQQLISDYSTKHPNVTIVYTKKNIDNYEQDLLNSLAAGTGPDIFSINNSWLPAYLDKATAAPASVFNVKDYKDAFVDVAVQDFVKDNKIFGVPLSVDSLALYYNKDLLGSAGIATPPKTWDELAQQVQKLKRQDRFGYFSRSGVAMGTNANVNRAVDILYLLMLQKGAQPYSQDGTQVTFGNSVTKNGNFINPAEEGLAYYTSFANPTSPNYNWNAQSNYSIDAFVGGQSAFLYSYSYTRDTIAQKAPNLNYDTTMVPQPNLDDPAVNFANYWGEVVSKQSKNAAVAWDFLKFISSKEELDKYYAMRKQPSSRKDLIALQIQDPDIGTFANANLTAKSFYKPNQQRIDSIFGQLIDNVVLRGQSVSNAISQAMQQAQAISQN